MNEAHPFGEHVDILDQPVNELELTVRASNALTTEAKWLDGSWHYTKRDMRIRDLVAMTSLQLRRKPNFGKVSLQDVRQALAKHGLYLSGEGPPAPEVRSPSSVFSPLTLSHRLQVIEAKLDLILSRMVPP